MDENTKALHGAFDDLMKIAGEENPEVVKALAPILVIVGNVAGNLGRIADAQERIAAALEAANETVVTHEEAPTRRSYIGQRPE